MGGEGRCEVRICEHLVHVALAHGGEWSLAPAREVRQQLGLQCEMRAGVAVELAHVGWLSVHGVLLDDNSGGGGATAATAATVASDVAHSALDPGWCWCWCWC